jgi:hypothetical protein
MSIYNFSVGPNLPSRFAVVNEILLYGYPISKEAKETKDSYSKTQIVTALALSLIAIGGAASAYYNPDLLQKWIGQTSPIQPIVEVKDPNSDLNIVEPSTIPTSPPPPLEFIKPGVPVRTNNSHTPLLTNTDPVLVCPPFENGIRNCFDLSKLPTPNLTTASAFSFLFILSFASPGSVQFPSATSKTLQTQAQKITDYILQCINPNNPNLTLTPFRRTGQISTTTYPPQTITNTSLEPNAPKQVTGHHLVSLKKQVLSNLNQRGIFLENHDSSIWACQFRPNGEKTCFNVLNFLQGNTSHPHYLLKSQLINSQQPTQGSRPVDNLMQNIAEQSQSSSNPLNTIVTESAPDNSQISVEQFMTNLQTSARHEVIRKTIENIGLQTGISHEFRDLTINIVRRVIQDVRSRKTGTSLTVKPEAIENSLKEHPANWLKFKLTKTPSAMWILRDWMQRKIQKAQEEAKETKNPSPYQDFVLTEQDNQILAQAIYGRMRIELETAASKMSIEQQNELKPYINACKKAENSYST